MAKITIYDSEIKKQAMEFIAEHPAMPIKTVAQMLNIPRQTLQNWIGLVRKDKTLSRYSAQQRQVFLADKLEFVCVRLINRIHAMLAPDAETRKGAKPPTLREIAIALAIAADKSVQLRRISGMGCGVPMPDKKAQGEEDDLSIERLAGEITSLEGAGDPAAGLAEEDDQRQPADPGEECLPQAE